MQKITCVYCGQSFEINLSLAGQPVKCPKCGSDNSVAAARAGTVRVQQIRPAAEREPVESVVAPVANQIVDNIEKVIVGKHNEIILTVMAYFAGGHVLLEDVPGVAKTVLARAFARTIGGSFKRIQCTPDLLPNDITGSSIFNPKTTDFEFRAGPLFAQIVLADEINRATPAFAGGAAGSDGGARRDRGWQSLRFARAIFSGGHAKSGGSRRHVSRCRKHNWIGSSCV